MSIRFGVRTLVFLRSLMCLFRCLPSFVLLSGLFTWLSAQATVEVATPNPMPPAQVTVVDGYLVVHLPGENATVVARPEGTPGEDRGWASWSQRSELVWRGQMHDSQGRLYNVRILPGFVAPWNEAGEGWSDAGSNLAEYGQAKTWTRIGKDSKASFKWGWKRSFWEFGLKGSKNAWAENFQRASHRTQRRSFGWPLAYPWALISSTFETLLRVPLGLVGGALGTVSGVALVPVAYTLWPSVKAVSNVAFRGVALPVCGWTWQIIAAPPAFLLSSAPRPSRADGRWMQVYEPGLKPASAEQKVSPKLSGQGLEYFSSYAVMMAALESEQRRSVKDAEGRMAKEISEVRARYASDLAKAKELREARLRDWIAVPENHAAILKLVEEGGDAATIRSNSEELSARLVAQGLSKEEADQVLRRLIAHPLVKSVPASAPRLHKTDPVKGAIGTVDKVLTERPPH